MTWEEYANRLTSTYHGGYQTEENIATFHHGIRTACRAMVDGSENHPGRVEWWQQVAESKQEERDKALAEVERLKALNDGLCERIAAAHEVIARNAERKAETASALSKQVGGDHYKKLAIQPIEYIHANGIPYIEGACIKYLTRHRDKGKAEDIRKVIHFCEILLEKEYGEGK